MKFIYWRSQRKYASPSLTFIFEFLILLNDEVNAANECGKNLDFNRNLSSVLSLGYEITYFCNETEKIIVLGYLAGFFLSWGMSCYRHRAKQHRYRGVDKSLARPTSRCILFHGENIYFDASLVIYRNSTNIPPIMIINRIYENQNLLSL